MQQTLYAVVEAFSCLKVWTRLYGNYVNSEHFVANGQVARRQLRRQWALCRERSGGATFTNPGSFFFTKRRLPGKCRHCASAPRKLAVRAAPIVKPPCFYSMRRLPGTIKMSRLSCFCFVRGSILFYARGSGQTRQLLIREEK